MSTECVFFKWGKLGYSGVDNSVDNVEKYCVKRAEGLWKLRWKM